MSTSKLKVNWRALVGWDSLSRSERRSLENAVDQLAGFPPERWPAELAVPLESDEPLYLLSFTPDMRAFVVPTPDGGVEVMRITNRHFLDWFQSLEVNGDAGG